MVPKQKRLKHRNPLSPLLFILDRDTLNKIIELAAKENIISGVGSKDIIGATYYQQFINDTLILCEAMKGSIKTLKFILYLNELLIGLQINFDKSQLIGLNRLDEDINCFIQIHDAIVVSTALILLV